MNSHNNHEAIRLTKTIQLPAVGYGTYLVPDQAAPGLVRQALETGYRHIDTAEGYDNEAGVGKGIRAGMDSLDLSREEVLVTTKLWPGNAGWDQHEKTYEDTLTALNASLDRLGMDYVDLYLIHAPFPVSERLNQWQALVDLRAQGKVRAIGVSNFGIHHLEEIRAAGLPLPDANQIELHPWSQKPELVSYLQKNEIAVIAYSSLVPLTNWRPEGGHAKTEQMLAEGSESSSPFHVLSEKYGITQAQLLLRWALQRGFAILPKSESPERMRENFDLFGFAISDADMATLDNQDRGDGVAWPTGDPLKAP